MGKFIYDVKGEVFIETGTFLGESLSHVADKYELCHSIEYDNKLYLDAVAKFASHPKVKVYHGSSPVLLPKIIDANRRTVFWLDAHFIGNGELTDAADPQYGQCPVLEELRAIMSMNWKHRPQILIDDAHLFTSEEFWTRPTETVEWQGHKADGYVRLDNIYVLRNGLDRKQWPRITEIAALLPGFDLSIRDNVIFAG